MKHQPKPYDIFISYRRDGGDHTAKIIRDALTERGYKTFSTWNPFDPAISTKNCTT